MVCGVWCVNIKEHS